MMMPTSGPVAECLAVAAMGFTLTDWGVVLNRRPVRVILFSRRPDWSGGAFFRTVKRSHKTRPQAAAAK